jgi:PPOX class probable F420-dependent enzyme
VTIRLDPGQLRLLDLARRATLATLAPDGRARLVPCCFALVERPEGQMIVTPIDAKPKRASDARQLARVRDVERDPRVTLLVDHWDEDWADLWWLRVQGLGRVVWPDDSPDEHTLAIAVLRGRYPQYLGHALEDLPVIAITPQRVSGWRAAPPP